MSTGGPNELSEGGEGGAGGGRYRPPVNPGELQPFWESVGGIQNVLAQEVLQIRDRLHGLESRLLASRLSAGRGAGSARANPAEFPEGGEGGGGRGEIVEIADIVEIAEFTGRTNVAAELAGLRQQFTAFDQRITVQLENLTQLVSKLQAR